MRELLGFFFAYWTSDCGSEFILNKLLIEADKAAPTQTCCPFSDILFNWKRL